jgi:hypothetical protein
MNLMDVFVFSPPHRLLVARKEVRVRRPGVLVTRLLILILVAAVLLLLAFSIVRTRFIQEVIVNIVRNLDSLLQHRYQKGLLLFGTASS